MTKPHSHANPAFDRDIKKMSKLLGEMEGAVKYQLVAVSEPLPAWIWRNLERYAKTTRPSTISVKNWKSKPSCFWRVINRWPMICVILPARLRRPLNTSEWAIM